MPEIDVAKKYNFNERTADSEPALYRLCSRTIE
jgi:hypothetical protein